MEVAAPVVLVGLVSTGTNPNGSRVRRDAAVVCGNLAGIRLPNETKRTTDVEDGKSGAEEKLRREALCHLTITGLMVLN